MMKSEVRAENKQHRRVSTNFRKKNQTCLSRLLLKECQNFCYNAANNHSNAARDLVFLVIISMKYPLCKLVTSVEGQLNAITSDRLSIRTAEHLYALLILLTNFKSLLLWCHGNCTKKQNGLNKKMLETSSSTF